MKKTYHFIGIGGIGMSGIAHLMLESGYRVSGSDLKETPALRRLEEKGARIFLGHREENVSGQDAVVYSSAISGGNPELLRARSLGIPLIKRAEALAELMKEKTAITVAGSHGKTTTTSLVSFMLLEAGLCPTAAIGGILKNISANACLGKGEFFVAEADESDGSFLSYRPKYSIITNIDREHLDYYRDFEHELETFSCFLRRTSPEGCVFACADDPHLAGLLKDYRGRRLLFGLNKEADIYADNIVFEGLLSEFDCHLKGRELGRFRLALGGRHNISNSLAVIALGLELGISPEDIRRSLRDYKGAGRRLEVKFRDSRYMVIDDYAHHPSEIKATLAAAENLKAKRRIVIFQPHRYSRTRLLLDDFAGSFPAADYLVVTDIYAASEEPIEGVNSLSLRDKIKECYPDKKVIYLPKEEIVPHLLGMLREGDLIMVLGAGDIVKVSDALAEELKK
ncbi:MAG: UDP-N-acetylmuramate--L-alanine ligase [Candidatus Omnitrophica bacterium]|jgi:UDP-N-acetylmuramate--alanine ligase|nr:UDP-N-acetylmuramate--L-alanine ligase [Candidatus Omnitrophota bacterium]MDD5077526.1 UDP-N-acetylmuramate--L-alanine ligase [Candidatus Omnitrophota bacterium]